MPYTLPQHLRSPRVCVTVLYLLYFLWLRATNRGDDLLEVLLLLTLGGGLALAWFVVALPAWLQPERRKTAFWGASGNLSRGGCRLAFL